MACAAHAAGSFEKHYRRTERYDGHKVYACSTRATSRVSLLRLVADEGLDLWKDEREAVLVRASPEQQYKLMPALARCTVVIGDVEEVVRNWEKEMMAATSNAEWFEEYHTYDELRAWYQDLAAQYPSLVTYIPTIGQSFEGRDQPGLRITSTRGGNKPSIYMQSQIHAREWISGATANYIVNELVTKYGSDANATSILDSVVLNFVPFTNPDGYDYTWTNDRLWRKNRNTNGGNLCRGVDVNRNYNSHWGEGGSSTSPCSETYMGAAPNSEPETKNTIGFFQQAAPVFGAIDWHSYSQLILRPYGWTRQDSPDETLLKSIGDGIRDVIFSVHGVSYTSQKSIDLYVTTGTASDWFYDDEATATNDGYRAAGFTIELRDTGRYGFELPPEQIIPTGEENYAAFVYFVSRVLASPISATRTTS